MHVILNGMTNPLQSEPGSQGRHVQTPQPDQPPPAPHPDQPPPAPLPRRYGRAVPTEEQEIPAARQPSPGPGAAPAEEQENPPPHEPASPGTPSSPGAPPSPGTTPSPDAPLSPGAPPSQGSSDSGSHPGGDTVSHEPTTTTGRHLEPVATTQILPVVASGPVRPALPGGREPAATTQILPVVTAAPTRRRRRASSGTASPGTTGARITRSGSTSPLDGTAVPTRRRRMALVVSLLVAALVLVAGTAAVTAVLLDGGTTATSASSPTPDQPSPTPTGNRQQWSQAWLKGAEQAWTLEPPDTGATSTIVRLTDDKLIRTTRQKEKGSVLVTVFRLGQGKPEQLWEEKITSTAPGTTIWNGKIIVGNNVIDINSRERSTAPWGAEADTYAATGVGVTACSGTSCALWTSLTEKKWEATIPVSKQAYINTGSRVGRYVLAGGRADKDPNFSVNIDTGEVKKMEESQPRTPHTP